jgi:hypothetical protein
MDAATQIIAEIRSLADIHDALRARFEALELSRITIGAAAGLTDGHASKLLSPVPVKRFGDVSLWPTLEVAGVKLCLVEALARVTSKLAKRARNAVRCQRVSTHMVEASRAVVLREAASKAGTARMAKLTTAARKRLAKAAAKARWSRSKKSRKP